MKDKHDKYLSYPILLWMGVLVFIPLLMVIILSFLSRDSLGNIQFSFTLDNYRKVLSPTYMKVFWNSFKLAILTAIISIILAYPVAYFTARLDKKWKRVSLVLVMIPFWTSSLMRTYGWVILLGNSGIINTVLLNLGIIQTPIQMMYKFSTVLIGTVYMLIPFMIISIFNSVDKLDQSLLEASYDLGAGKVKTFINVTLPLTLSGVLRGFTLVFIPALGLYFVSDLLGGGQTIYLANLINNQVTKGRNRPQAAALAIGMILLVAIVLLGYNHLNKRWQGVSADEK
ncbi:ABC transporter permease [Erysipelothrix urinaevulpis]|uniref:ABC transporter permease n=1 Tax=Erysipelothrix urinaevulpis TaxID=2683717 RepID=UPI0013574137|nr:ABC transporter permease [Erysipelothrix urinaevulpis]